MAEWIASEMILTEPLAKPATIFMMIRLILEQTDTMAALVFLFMYSFLNKNGYFGAARIISG